MTTTVTSPTDFSAGHFMTDSDVRQYKAAVDALSAFLGDKTSYTPAWTGTSSNPAIGNGTLTGKYQKVGKLVKFSISIVVGSSTTFGSGAWRFALPSTADVSNGPVGPAMLLDSSAGARHLAMALFVSTTTVGVWVDTEADSGIQPTSPFTFATADEIHIEGSYWES